MTDIFDKAKRSEIMSRIKGKDTAPELAVRKITFALGYRYRLHRKDLPGKPDLVFPRRKKVIFVHGCFWHQHKCNSWLTPKTNEGYWLPKLARNVERDKIAVKHLKKLGWKVLIIWACEIKSVEKVTSKIVKFLD